MLTARCVVDNRVFLLGLDKLYRDAMMAHERAELLSCARRVAAALQVETTSAPVEGYYADDEELTEYFRLVRALQQVDASRTSEVAAMPEFQRLREVLSAPLYGRPFGHEALLPVTRDALSQALFDTRPEWTVARLTAVAHARALDTDDISLVGLAARAQDAVVLAALRESVVLYAESISLGKPPSPEYVWNVDDHLAIQAKRFIDAFNALFGDELPPPRPAQVERYWHAARDNPIFGRCVRLGQDETPALRYYHWAICAGSDALTVHEFWQPEIWTTARYREALRPRGKRPDL